VAPPVLAFSTAASQTIIIRIADGGHADLSVLLEAQHVGQVGHAHAAHADVGHYEAAGSLPAAMPSQNTEGARGNDPRHPARCAGGIARACDPLSVAHYLQSFVRPTNLERLIAAR